MLMLFLVLGSALLIARVLAYSFPRGRAYGAVAAITSMLCTPIAGAAIGVLLAYAGSGDARAADIVMNCLAFSLLAAVVMPFVSIYYRRQRSRLAA